jgi:hypothetical protein
MLEEFNISTIFIPPRDSYIYLLTMGLQLNIQNPCFVEAVTLLMLALKLAVKLINILELKLKQSLLN